MRPFLEQLTIVVDFGATHEALPVLKALRSLPGLSGRKKVAPSEIDTGLPVGSWRRLVLAAPHLETGAVDWKAYTFCVLEHFHRMLRRREIFARNSSKWGGPRAKLLADHAWEKARPKVLASLNLPSAGGEHLAARAELLQTPTARSPPGCPTTPRWCSARTVHPWPRCNPSPNPPPWPSCARR